MRLLIKISGESISSDKKVFDDVILNSFAQQLKSIVESNIEVAVVIGGGNIVRGKEFENLGFDRVDADHMGMLATTLNCMSLSAALEKAGVKTLVMSATLVDGVEAINIKKAKEYLSQKAVVLFGGGTGEPYFSTDTACALRAIEIKADKILIAKNGVDGVYDKDPNVYSDAKFFKEISFNDILKLDLKVIDATAASLCNSNHVDAFVFNANVDDSLLKAAKGEIIGTTIKA